MKEERAQQKREKLNNYVTKAAQIKMEGTGAGNVYNLVKLGIRGKLESLQLVAASHRLGLTYSAWETHKNKLVPFFVPGSKPQWLIDPMNLAGFHVNTMVPLALEKYAKQTMHEEIQKGLRDGHEKPDVIKYRQDVFIPHFERYLLQQRQYEVGNVMKEVIKDLPPVHAELSLSFMVNLAATRPWFDRSHFICSTKGCLEEAGELLEYGKNHEGYCNAEKLAE
ncbi:hypothetical protein BT69DRAFT_1292345 [Atractiella rhizophila]|nr:hypothetical protein BT69DRAFT_1292345 [Atractiella rhizophila]